MRFAPCVAFFLCFLLGTVGIWNSLALGQYYNLPFFLLAMCVSWMLVRRAG